MDADDRSRWSVEALGGASAYDDRWTRLEAQGKSVHGEADFVESLNRGSVLDAGCGTGRVAIELAGRGLEVVGVDLDPVMLARARAKGPSIPWVEADLVGLDLGRRFGVVVLAGNVMIFLRPGTEADVVASLAAHLEPAGLLVAGFQVQPGGLDLATYDEHARAAGLRLRDRWATWDGQPFGPAVGGPNAAADYAVSVHERPA